MEKMQPSVITEILREILIHLSDYMRNAIKQGKSSNYTSEILVRGEHLLVYYSTELLCKTTLSLLRLQFHCKNKILQQLMEMPYNHIKSPLTPYMLVLWLVEKWTQVWISNVSFCLTIPHSHSIFLLKIAFRRKAQKITTSVVYCNFQMF